VRLALVFRQRQQRGVPRLRTLTCGVVDGQAEKVADIGTGGALDRILVHDRRPHPGEIDLRGRWCGG
jgi:hypothetical protein